VARNGGARFSLAQLNGVSGPWRRTAGGARRATPFGQEIVRFGLPVTEQFLVVDEPQGAKTWRWRIGRGLTPRLSGGGVELFDGAGRDIGISLKPPRILDADGTDVSPRGTAWRLGRDSDGWLLRLRLDDARLPSPYTIDPAATYQSVFSGTASNRSEVG
jgi:hypothetical protein